jgi:hypothetical protein
MTEEEIAAIWGNLSKSSYVMKFESEVDGREGEAQLSIEPSQRSAFCRAVVG